jgi:hypothetical protein
MRRLGRERQNLKWDESLEGLAVALILESASTWRPESAVKPGNSLKAVRVG